jgi:hypothetical protein
VLPIAYACDHESHSRAHARVSGDMGEQDHAQLLFIRGADLVVHDAQCTAVECPETIGCRHRLQPGGWQATTHRRSEKWLPRCDNPL